MHISRTTWAFGMAAALVALSGCPGKLEDKERFLLDAGSSDAAGAFGDDGDAGPCGDVVARIFVPSCGSTGCHSASGAQQGLDLVSSGLSSRVVGVPGTTCTGTLANPDDPASSLLYTKLSPSPGCGAQMPLAQPALSAADAACVLAWIAAQ